MNEEEGHKGRKEALLAVCIPGRRGEGRQVARSNRKEARGLCAAEPSMRAATESLLCPMLKIESEC